MVKTEDLTQREVYCIQHLSPSYGDGDDDDDDTSMIVQLETCQGADIYTSLPACPFDIDDVSRMNNGILKCMMTYRTITEPRIVYIFIYIDYTDIVIVRHEYFSNMIFVFSDIIYAIYLYV